MNVSNKTILFTYFIASPFRFPCALITFCSSQGPYPLLIHPTSVVMTIHLLPTFIFVSNLPTILHTHHRQAPLSRPLEQTNFQIYQSTMVIPATTYFPL